MELHTLQDALKHEIQQHQKLVSQIKQDPQDVELKKQLHERQARITALSEKQKKVVEQLRKDLVNKQHQRQHGTSGDVQPHATKMVSRPPVAIAIPLVKGGSHNAQQQQQPPLRPVAPVVPVALLAPVAPVAPVTPVTPTAATSLSNGQKTPPRIEASAQTPPGVHAAPHRSKQAQVGTSQVPLRIPQFPAVQRLVGKSLAILPEIRPKPLASSPSAQERPHCNGKSGSGAHARALHAHVANGTAGTTIKSGSSVDEAKPTPTRVQVAPGRGRLDGSTNHGPSPHHSMSGHGRSPSHGMVNHARSRMSDSAEKVAFMVALGLATPEHVEELQSRRQERKRRTTANPLYSGAYYEPECKRGAASYLSSSSSTHHTTRRRVPDDPTWRAEAEECCCVCKRSGLLLTCDACSGLYHLECLEPPLKSTPRGVWFCQECQQQGFKKDDAMLWPETLAVVHAYIAQKTTKEEERRRLLKRSTELRCQCEATEGRVSTVGLLITKSVESRSDLVAKEDQSRASLERLRTLLALVQDSRSATAACATTLVSL